MNRSQGRSQPERRSAWLAKTKREIDIGDKFGSIRVEEAHSRYGSEDKGVIMGQVEVVVTPKSDRASLAKLEGEEEVEGMREDEGSRQKEATPCHQQLV